MVRGIDFMTNMADVLARIQHPALLWKLVDLGREDGLKLRSRI